MDRKVTTQDFIAKVKKANLFVEDSQQVKVKRIIEWVTYSKEEKGSITVSITEYIPEEHDTLQCNILLEIIPKDKKNVSKGIIRKDSYKHNILTLVSMYHNSGKTVEKIGKEFLEENTSRFLNDLYEQMFEFALRTLAFDPKNYYKDE